MEYEIIRSKRRTLSLEVTRGARVLVRAPVNCPRETIDSFVRSHEAWLKKAVERVRAGELAHPEPDEQERQRLIERAKQVIPRRVAYFSLIMGLTPTGVRTHNRREDALWKLLGKKQPVLFLAADAVAGRVRGLCRRARAGAYRP